MKIDFKIEHIDPIGQGVSKQDAAVTFIKKTLPGEMVEAVVFSKKKGVQFAHLSGISEPSTDRKAPECPHYQSCNGCDYQHTNYDKELEFKKNALTRHMFKFPDMPITVHGAKRRLGYRNRIQLHYDKKKKVMGLMNYKNEIIPVPECKIIDPSVAYELRALYADNNWIRAVEKEPIKGHVELYSKHNEAGGHNVKLSVNRPYANGGFTQVNAEMNERLRVFVQKKAEELIPPKAVVYDLFGGNGNLSVKFRNPTLVVDKYRTTPTQTAHQKFFSLDLYDQDAVKKLIALKAEGYPRPNWLIIDPPRSGLKNLNEFLNEFKPDGFIFIACEATSFTRDTLGILNNYELKSVEIFDLFPSTQHFETIGIFTRRPNNA
ncbi:MAG: class I SAM-dependent RNA methyltransferase [Bacteriovorax sp.]|nr:class I SAM-dependent RNA methyltransferase [Bacteriovorax sp.]